MSLFVWSTDPRPKNITWLRHASEKLNQPISFRQIYIEFLKLSCRESRDERYLQQVT